MAEGARLTSRASTEPLEVAGMRTSVGGCGHMFDNEDVHLEDHHGRREAGEHVTLQKGYWNHGKRHRAIIVPRNDTPERYGGSDAFYAALC